ncbi:MAG: hypothetical protein Kow0037_31780 [Calditrichia bacterium]
MVRKYNRENRLKQAEQTRQNIILAAEKLLGTKPLADVSMQAIAEEAKTTVQTFIRHFGSREGCLNAVVEKVLFRVEQERAVPPSGSVEDCAEVLLSHYEKENRLVLNLLAQEHNGSRFIGEALQIGREFHRKWLKECFRGRYPEGIDEEILDELVLATDIYAWKLLRLDMDRSRRQTKQVMISLIKKILEVA